MNLFVVCGDQDESICGVWVVYGDQDGSFLVYGDESQF